MVVSSLKTQDTISNKHLSRVRDDVDKVGTQTELIVSRNIVTQTDPVIIGHVLKAYNANFSTGNTSFHKQCTITKM